MKRLFKGLVEELHPLKYLTTSRQVYWKELPFEIGCTISNGREDNSKSNLDLNGAASPSHEMLESFTRYLWEGLERPRRTQVLNNKLCGNRSKDGREMSSPAQMDFERKRTCLGTKRRATPRCSLSKEADCDPTPQLETRSKPTDQIISNIKQGLVWPTPTWTTPGTGLRKLEVPTISLCPPRTCEPAIHPSQNSVRLLQLYSCAVMWSSAGG